MCLFPRTLWLRPCGFAVTASTFLVVAKIRRTESVPSDINNPVDRPPEAPQFGTLPKAITKKVHHLPAPSTSVLHVGPNIHPFTLLMLQQDHPPVLNQLDSSSNPSSTTSSTPSSPAPFQQSNPPSATPPPNPSPKGHRDSRFNFPGELGWTALTHRSRVTGSTLGSHFSLSPLYEINTFEFNCAFLQTPPSQRFSNRRSLSLPCLSAFVFLTVAACYFQHRQQFIFPGECHDALLLSRHPTLQTSDSRQSLSSACLLSGLWPLLCCLACGR